MATAPDDGTPVLLYLKEPVRSFDIGPFAPFDSLPAVIGWYDGQWNICFHEEWEWLTKEPDDFRGWVPLTL